jgi:arylsulfatase A
MQKTAKATGQSVVPLVRDEKVERLLTEEDQQEIEALYTQEAVSFIRASKDKPFFLYFPHTAVHTPIHPGKDFQGKSENGRFGDWVQQVDWSVGRVLDTLRELHLDQNTLVVFTSDNGPWLIKGPDGGSALPLRGGKGTTWEGGVRVPTLAWWPSKIPPGTVCNAVTSTIDLMPTCVSVAGGQLPSYPVIDGRDLSPLLFGQTQQAPRPAHYYFAGYNIQAVRQGPWKLALMTQGSARNRGSVDDDAKVNPRLYNLDTEIDERTNLADQHPDIVAKLTALAHAMTIEIGGNEPKARRPAGEVANPQTLYPSDPEGRGKRKPGASKASKAKPVALGALQLGDSLPTDHAPQIAGLPFTIRCHVSASEPDAILLAHGGASAGYALHLSGGRLRWVLRHGKTLTQTELPFTSDGNPQHIEAALARDGTLTLKVNDHPPATAQSPGLLLSQPKEDFCVGHDNQVPVATYTAKGKSSGTISALQVTYDAPPQP